MADDGTSRPKLGLKKLENPELPSWVCVLSIAWITHSGGSRLLCCLQPYREAHVPRNWKFQPTASEDQRPASNPMSDHGNRFTGPSRAFGMTAAQASSLTATSGETAAEPSSYSSPGFLMLKTFELIILLFFKLLNLGMICYTAIDNT